MQPKTSTLIYLASPYSDISQNVMRRRFETVCLVASKIFVSGYNVFSPIAHSEPISRFGLLDAAFGTWREFDLLMLAKCDALVLLLLTGWERSVGMKVEYNAAVARTMPIYQCDIYGEIIPVLYETTDSFNE